MNFKFKNDFSTLTQEQLEKLGYTKITTIFEPIYRKEICDRCEIVLRPREEQQYTVDLTCKLTDDTITTATKVINTELKKLDKALVPVEEKAE